MQPGPQITCGSQATLRLWGWILPRLVEAGMPVGYLNRALPQIRCAEYRDVDLYAPQRGSFEVDSSDGTTALTLTARTLPLLALAHRDGISVAYSHGTTGSGREEEAIDTFYHECFHTYVFHCDGVTWNRIVESARAYYRDSPLRRDQGGEARVPNGSDGYDYVSRLINEAGAEYVGHRAKILWRALDDLRRFAIMDGNAAPSSPGADALPFIEGRDPPDGTLYATHTWRSPRKGEVWAENRWYEGITKHHRRFGYTPTSWSGKPGLSEPSSAGRSILPIFAPLADYCDRILEGKVLHTYDAFLKRYANAL